MADRRGDREEYIAACRKTLAAEKDEVEVLMKEANDQLPELFNKVFMLLKTVTSKSEPSESHWIVAQCRTLCEQLTKDETRITRYLNQKASVARYDREKAKKEAEAGRINDL